MPLFGRIEDTISYIIAKGLPAQFTFVPLIKHSSIEIYLKLLNLHSQQYAPKHHKRILKTR